MRRARQIPKQHLLKMMYQSDFIAFVPFAFAIAFPGRSLRQNWHIDIIADALQASLEDGARRLVINAPPRCLKSFISSIAFPAFALGRNPTLKIMSVVANRELASDLCGQLHRLLSSDRYRLLFPHVSAQRKRDAIQLMHGGSFSSTPYFCSPVGRGADIMIVDDPVSPSDAQSNGFNNEAASWFAAELAPRLNDKGNSVAILVMQRLHVNDLTTAFFTGQDRRTLSFSAVSSCEERHALPDHSTFVRAPRSVLNPAIETLEDLYDIYCSIGDASFTAQYLQDPWHSQWMMGPMYYDFDTTDWDPTKGAPESKSMFNRSIYLQYECFGVGKRPPYLSVSPLTEEQNQAMIVYRQAKLLKLMQEDCQ